MSSISQSDWLTTEEAAAYLKCKCRSLLLLVRQGKIKAAKLETAAPSQPAKKSKPTKKKK